MANEFEKSLGSTQFYDLSTYGYLGSPILDFSKQPVDNLVADDIIYSALANQPYLSSSKSSSGSSGGVSLTKNLLGVSASKLSAENYLNAIFGNERGELNSQTTLTGPKGQRATATGSYQITEGTRKGIYNNHFKSGMSYAEFDRRYRTDKRFEKEVALSLANDHIRGSKTAAEALGKWYSPKDASTGRWNVVPSPEYGNRLTVGQYVNRAAKGLKYKDGGQVTSAKQQLIAKCYKKGGKVTENPPKIYTDRKQFEQAQRMYNDSLLLYTLSEKQRLKGTNNKENILFNKKGSDVLDENERRWYQDTRKQLKGKFFPDSEVTIKIQGEDDRKRPNSKENDYNNDEYFHPDIKPIKGYNWSTETGLTRLLESNDNFLYKKPVQPVVYQPQFTNTNQGVVEGKVIMNDGKNAAILNSKIVPKMKRLGLPMELKNQERIPSLKGQPIPLKIEYPEQKGNPVYGPGNTIVGYSNNMNFKPAYQYTGALNNQLNLQDKTLLENPDKLKEYILKKDNYKFEKGGQAMSAKQQLISKILQK